MQTSSSSRTAYLRSRARRGFTLVELLISLAIIGLIYATVLVNFASYDSVTILKSTAYEVAGTLREAQVLSLSVLGISTASNLNFRTTYGVHFETNTNEYLIFNDTQPPTGLVTPEYDDTDTDIKNIFTYTMTRNTKVTEICVKRSDQSQEECDVISLDISFKRPEFAALFYAKENAGGVLREFNTAENRAIESAKIKLKSDNGENVWVIEIGLLGHISVKKQDSGSGG